MDIRPSCRYVGVMRLWLTVCACSLCFICGAVYYFCHIPALISGVGIFALYAALWVWYIPRFVSLHGATLSKGCVRVRTGVLIRRQHVIPDVRQMYCRKVTDPLSRALKIASVRIEMACGSVTVHGLSEKDADLLLGSKGG